MPDVGPPGWLKSWIATSLASTVYASVGVSASAILYLIAPTSGPAVGLVLRGHCIPPGIMSLIDTSDWMFRRRLRNLKQLFDDGLISEALYERHRQRAMDWRGDRLTARPRLCLATRPGKKRTKPGPPRRNETPPAAIPKPEGQPEVT